MAKFEDIRIKYESRGCEVDGRPGYSPKNVTLDEQEYLKEEIQKLKMEKFKQDQMDKLLRAVEGEDDETR